MIKRIALTTLSAVASFGAIAGLAGTAGATSSPADNSVITQYTTSYTSPSNTSIAVHTGLNAGTTVEARCFREGQQLNGNAYWFLIQEGGELGYVHRGAISAPSNLPHC
jgi:hypothetical protein